MTNNNFKFTDILAGIQNNEPMSETITKLEKINNSYADNILVSIKNRDLSRAIVLLNDSVKFETKMNNVQTEAIYLNDEEIQARADNLVLINGMTRDNAIALAYRRANRLRSNSMTKTSSIESGHFMV